MNAGPTHGLAVCLTCLRRLPRRARSERPAEPWCNIDCWRQWAQRDFDGRFRLAVRARLRSSDAFGLHRPLHDADPFDWPRLSFALALAREMEEEGLIQVDAPHELAFGYVASLRPYFAVRLLSPHECRARRARSDNDR